MAKPRLMVGYFFIKMNKNLSFWRFDAVDHMLGYQIIKNAKNSCRWKLNFSLKIHVFYTKFHMEKIKDFSHSVLGWFIATSRRGDRWRALFSRCRDI